MMVCLENMFPRIGHLYRPDEFTDVLKRHPQLMMTLDLAHAHIRGPKDQAAAFVRVARGADRPHPCG